MYAVHYSTQGGIEIESNQDSVTTAILTGYTQYKDIAMTLKTSVVVLESIITSFDEYYFSFLEINPLVVQGNKFYFLDMAVEVDSEASFFVEGAWREMIREGSRKIKTEEERAIEALKDTLQLLVIRFLIRTGQYLSYCLEEEHHW